MRASSLKQGTRGPATRSSTEPIRQRSPMRAPETSTPGGREILAEHGGLELAADQLAPERGVLARVGVDRLVGTAVVDLVGLLVAAEVVRRAPATGPLTGVLTIAEGTARRPVCSNAGRPTLTESTLPLMTPAYGAAPSRGSRPAPARPAAAAAARSTPRPSRRRARRPRRARAAARTARAGARPAGPARTSCSGGRRARASGPSASARRPLLDQLDCRVERTGLKPVDSWS